MHEIKIAKSGTLRKVPIVDRNAARAEIIKPFLEKWKYPVFIETGTYRGDMIKAVLGLFTWIISIEYGEGLAKEARKRFSNQYHVEIVHGDSAGKLPKLLDRLKRDDITGEVLFFLDAHYSGVGTARAPLVTPIEGELQAIAQAQLDPVVILIDDAVDFGKSNYPAYSWVQEFCQDNFPEFELDIYKDIFRIYKDGV